MTHQDSTSAVEMIDSSAPTSPPSRGLDPRFQCEVEALIVSSSRPIAAERLAQALGLINVPAVPASDAPQDVAGVNVTIKKPRRKKSDGFTDPLATVAEAVKALNDGYEASGRSFRIERVSGGYRLMTLPAFAGIIAALNGIGASSKLSRPAVETLAIIAYRQPVTRAHLEAIRGVACGEVLRTLLDRRLITIAGRAEELGRPILYATSRQFLQAFGLSSVKDLPTVGELGLKT
ncbi:MAG: SMC-Scp complex subunit ScpB [Phycisphaerales bacterium]